MRAVVCECLGDPSLLKIEERPIPDAGPGEIVVKVGAAAVNFPDVLVVAGDCQHKPPLPFVPGMEAAGNNRTAWDRVPRLGPAIASSSACGRVPSPTMS